MTNLAIGRKMREPRVSLNTLSYSSPEAVVRYFRKGDYLIGVAHVTTPVGVFRFAAKMDVSKIEMELAKSAAKETGAPLSQVVEAIAEHQSSSGYNLAVGAPIHINVGAAPAAPLKMRGVDRLAPGQSLSRNEGLRSKNGRVKLVFQTDGNLVLYGDGRPLWWTGPSDATRAVMQTDGNFVLYAGSAPRWDSGTAGRPGSRLIVQDDGNVATYPPSGGASWESETSAFRYHGGPSTSFFQDVAKVATAPSRAFASKVLSSAYGRPITVDSVSVSPKELAQAAQAVLSFVPVIGTGVNAAIAAGVALAKGDNITDALASAAKNALPGGPIVQQGFDVAFKAVRAAASGEDIGKAALASLRESLPGGDAVKKAFDVGVALAHGQNVQQAALGAVASLAPGALPGLGTLAGSAIPPGLGALVSEAANSRGAAKVLATVKEVTAALPIQQHINPANFALPPIGVKTAAAFESANKAVRVLRQVKELQAARLPVPASIAKTLDKTKQVLARAKAGEPKAVKAAKLLKIASEFQSNVERLKQSAKTPITSLTALNLSPAALRSLAATHSSSELAVLKAQAALHHAAGRGGGEGDYFDRGRERGNQRSRYASGAFNPHIVMPGTPTGDIFFG